MKPKRGTMKPIRQGDVILIPVAKLPSGNVKRHVQLTLAHGEATGHHHTLYPKLTAVFGGDMPLNAEPAMSAVIDEVVINGKRFIKLDTEWLLRHKEHKELRIPPACYEIVIEREYDPFEEAMKKVID